MPYALGIFKVKDFDMWKSGFTAPDSMDWRKRDGGGKYQLFQLEKDPQTAVVLVEWDNLDNARRHAQSRSLSKIHQKGEKNDYTSTRWVRG